MSQLKEVKRFLDDVVRASEKKIVFSCKVN